MTSIDRYLAGLDTPTRELFAHIRAIVHETVEGVDEGVSYGMPAYLYRGKGLLSAMACKRFLSLYPFSGKTLAALEDQMVGFEKTSGSVHFSCERPIPDDLLRAILITRQKEIEAKL